MAIADKRILLIEDDTELALIVESNLKDEGYAVRVAHDGATGLSILASEPLPDVLILDLVLPRVDGLQICRHVRAHNAQLPIIIVSGKGSETQRVVGLELGADDYLTKPYSVVELVARVRALLRRVEAYRQSATAAASNLKAGLLQLDPIAREVRLREKLIPLTAREFELLQFFMQQPGQVFSRIELLNQVWGYAHDGYEHTVNSHINRLRAKIESDPAHPDYIVTVWGVGYKFVLPAREHGEQA